MKNLILSAALVCAAGAANALPVPAMPVGGYSYDFETYPTGTTGGYIATSGAASGVNGFSGNMLTTYDSTNFITVTLTGLAAHEYVNIGYALAFLDSWDAVNGGVAPDYFNMSIDGVEVMQASIASASGTIEQIPSELYNRVSGNYGGSSVWTDVLYGVAGMYAHTGSSLTLSFWADGAGWQSGQDESFAIDSLNITLLSTTLPAVPVPGSLPLAAGGLGLLGLLARRKRKSA